MRLPSEATPPAPAWVIRTPVTQPLSPLVIQLGICPKAHSGIMGTKEWDKGWDTVLAGQPQNTREDISQREPRTHHGGQMGRLFSSQSLVAPSGPTAAELQQTQMKAMRWGMGEWQCEPW